MGKKGDGHEVRDGFSEEGFPDQRAGVSGVGVDGNDGGGRLFRHDGGIYERGCSE